MQAAKQVESDPIVRWMDDHKPLIGGTILVAVLGGLWSMFPSGQEFWRTIINPAPSLGKNGAVLALAGGFSGSLISFWLLILLDHKRNLEQGHYRLVGLGNDLLGLHVEVARFNLAGIEGWTGKRDENGKLQLPLFRRHVTDTFRSAFSSGTLSYDLRHHDVVSRLFSVYSNLDSVNRLADGADLLCVRSTAIPADDLTQVYNMIQKIYIESVFPDLEPVQLAMGEQARRKKKQARRLGNVAGLLGILDGVFLVLVLSAAF